MEIEKIPQRKIDCTYGMIVIAKINQLIDKINYWKKAHLKLQEQFIRCKNERRIES